MPKIVDHDRRRADVVDAARVVIATEGLDAATMRRIADEAGCTTGRITHYFSDKHEVLIAVLRSVHRAAGQRMMRRMREATPSDRLRLVLQEALPLDDVRLTEWKVWLAFWGRATDDPELADEQRSRYREWATLVGQLLDREPNHPEVDRLIAVIDGIGLRATLDPAAFPPERQLAALSGTPFARAMMPAADRKE